MPNITYIQSAHGTISGPSTVTSGGSITVTATPDSGYYFGHLEITPSSGGIEFNKIIENITSDITVAAVFTTYNFYIWHMGPTDLSNDNWYNGRYDISKGENYEINLAGSVFYDNSYIGPEFYCSFKPFQSTNFNVSFSESWISTLAPRDYYVRFVADIFTYSSETQQLSRTGYLRVSPPASPDNVITFKVTQYAAESTPKISPVKSGNPYTFRGVDINIFGGIIDGLNIPIHYTSGTIQVGYVGSSTNWITNYFKSGDNIYFYGNANNTNSVRTAYFYYEDNSVQYVIAYIRQYPQISVTYNQSQGGTISGDSLIPVYSIYNELWYIPTIIVDDDYNMTGLTITPASSGYIVHTIGNPWTFRADNDLTLTPTFALKPIVITYDQTSGGTISGPNRVNSGDTITISATPNTGYHLDSISISPASAGTVSGTTISNITADITVTPVFALNTYNITYNQTTGGTISGSATVTHGGNITVTTTPSSGYQFTSLSINPASSGTISGTTISNITSDITVTPVFDLVPYNITYSQSSHGTISGPATVVPGGSITVTTTHDTGYHFASLSISPASGGTVSGTTISNISSNLTVSAVFDPDTYNITYSQSSHGTISGPATALHGGSITIYPNPDSGYIFDTATISPASAGTVSGTTISNITGNISVTPSFIPALNITYVQTTGGTISGVSRVVTGGSVTVTVTPNTNYVFDHLSVTPSTAGTVVGNVVSNISSDITISATFVRGAYSITYNSATHGTITGPGSASPGGSITVTPIPDEGYSLLSLSISPASGGTISGTTISNISSDISVSATFAVTKNVAYGTSPNGTVSGPTRVAVGGSVTVTASPATGYQLSYISINPTTAGTIDGTTVSGISKDFEVTGTFTAIAPTQTYTVTYQQAAHGSASGVSSVSAGGSFFVTFTADSGYQLSDWTADGNCIINKASNQVSNVRSNITIIPTFTATPSPGPTPGSVVDLGWRPIWKNTNTVITTSSEANQKYVKAWVDGELIEEGIYYGRPSINQIIVDLNKLTDKLWNSPGFTATTRQRITNSLKFQTGTVSQGAFTADVEWNVNFVPDWSWSNLDYANFDHLSKPFNNNLVNGQYFPYSVLQKTGSSATFTVVDPDGVTTTYSPSAGYITDFAIPINKDGHWVINGRNYDTFCADYVLYYFNSFGGWDSIALEGHMLGSRDFDRYNIINHNNEKFSYKNKITKSYLLRTGWMTDEQSAQMYNIFGTTQAVLHDIKNNVMYDVNITDSSAEDKTFKNQGRQLVRYDITVQENQIKTRR